MHKGMFVPVFVIAGVVGFMSHAEAAGKSNLKNDRNGKCITAVTINNNVSIQQESCESIWGYHRQGWYWIAAGDYGNAAGSWMFQNTMHGGCLAPEGDSIANAAKIVMTACDATNPSQHWIMLTRDLPGTKTKFMNGRSGKCLDIHNNVSGTTYQQYDCARASYWPQQMWRGEFFGG